MTAFSTLNANGIKLRCMVPRETCRPNFVCNSAWMRSWYLLTSRTNGAASNATTIRISSPANTFKAFRIRSRSHNGEGPLPTLVLAYRDWKPRSSAALHFTGTPAAQIVAFGFRYLGTPFPPESVENPHRAGLATLLVGKRRAPAEAD